MKDYIITTAAVSIMTFGILLCHKYALNINYSEPMESIPEKPIINTEPYDDWNNGYYNDYISPVVTTVATQKKGLAMLQSTSAHDDILIENPDDEYIAETEITTTFSRSILENANAPNVTVHQFSIIQNPQIPQTETTPASPDDFSLLIN